MNRLSNGREMRVEGRITQREMFDLLGRFNPQTEGIAKSRDIDETITKGLFSNLESGIRTSEYRVYRYPGFILGSTITWVEDGISYRHLVPDVPVNFNGKEISLQKVPGIGIYDSIDLLRIEQSGNREFTVSPADFSALSGRVRATGFNQENDRGEWLYGHGALFGSKGFEPETTGWHGSVGRGTMTFNCDWRIINIYPRWSETLPVLLASGIYLEATVRNIPLVLEEHPKPPKFFGGNINPIWQACCSKNTRTRLKGIRKLSAKGFEEYLAHVTIYGKFLDAGRAAVQAISDLRPGYLYMVVESSIHSELRVTALQNLAESIETLKQDTWPFPLAYLAEVYPDPSIREDATRAVLSIDLESLSSIALHSIYPDTRRLAVDLLFQKASKSEFDQHYLLNPMNLGDVLEFCKYDDTLQYAKAKLLEAGVQVR